MAATALFIPTPEQTKVATQQFEHANEAVNSQNFDYGIELLQTCCEIDPGNLIYRRRLRQIQKLKFGNSKRGNPMAWLTTFFTRRKMKACFRRKEDREVLELGEVVLTANPWDTKTQILMGLAAERLGLRETAIFIVEAARHKNPNDPKVNRPLAQLYERTGAYAHAVAAWQLVARHDPKDQNAAQKAKDLAATQTIEKGHYKERSASHPVLAPDSSVADQAQPGSGDTAQLDTGTQAELADPQEFLQKAQTLKQNRHWEEARQALKAGLEATGNHFEIQQALLDLEIEPFRQNLQTASQRLKADPRNVQLREQQERLRKEIANRELALYRQRSDRFPHDLKAKLELGIRLLQLEQVDEAVVELQHARRDPQLRGKALVHLGLAFLFKDNWPLAKRNLDEALHLLPPSDTHTRKEVLYQLSQGAAGQQDWNQALQYAHEFAALDYQYKDIRQLLLDWQEKAKSK